LAVIGATYLSRNPNKIFVFLTNSGNPNKNLLYKTPEIQTKKHGKPNKKRM
jgi:hypothetical protein